MDDWTRVPRRLKKKWKARENALAIAAWFTLMGVFIYGLIKLSERLPKADWP